MEYELVKDIEGIEFLVFDKSQGLSSYLQLRKKLKSLRFSALLHMQMSLRASMIALMVDAPIKLGFDRQRAKDLQWLFTNHKITYQSQQHVIDSFFGFSQALGVDEKIYRWNIPIPDSANEFALQHLQENKPVLVISPCSSMSYRNWNAEGYANVARYAIEKYSMQVVITGGPSTIEQQYAQAITQLCNAPLVNLVGRTTLKQLLAIFKHTDVVIAPDSGPAHLATAVGTPVIGLYATTNPDRARPYMSAEYVVDCYAQAIQKIYHKPVADVPFGLRAREMGSMDLISTEKVKSMLDKLMLNQNK